MELTQLFEMSAKRHLGLRVKIVDWKQSSLALSRVREACHKSINSHANFICRAHLCLPLIQLHGNENRFDYSSFSSGKLIEENKISVSIPKPDTDSRRFK